MRKSEFLSLLRNVVSAPANETSVPGGQGAKGSSYLTKWIADAAQKDSQHLEHALRKYAPEAAGAKTARDYVQAVMTRRY
jgi:hypothetical protein